MFRQLTPVDAQVPNLDIDGVSRALAATVERACGRRREDRYATVHELARTLEAVSTDDPSTMRVIGDAKSRSTTADDARNGENTPWRVGVTHADPTQRRSD